MYEFIILFLISLAGTLYSLPHSVRKLSESGYVAKDMYKVGLPEIPTNAGIIIVFTSFISISFFPLFSRLISALGLMEFNNPDLLDIHLAFLLVVSIFALYGLVDDLVDVGRILKFILPVTFCYPLISVVRPTIIWLPLIGYYDLSNILFLDITSGDMLRIFIVPTYIMVVANLVNMHSGYNGLQSGLSIILIFTLIIKSYVVGTLGNILPVASIFGAMVAFYSFNKYPSKVFEGNIGSLFFGSVIGSIIVIQEFWWFGFFILIPHTFNFILWVIWLYLIKKSPEQYLTDTGSHQKFGMIDDHGFIVVPNRLTLKWIPNFYFKINENDTVKLLHLLTFIFCIIALIAKI